MAGVSMLNFGFLAGSRRPARVWLVVLAASGIAPLHADDEPTIAISLENDVFTPAEIQIPANRPFVLKLTNRENAPVEIESKALKIEKIVAAGSEMIVHVKPQKPGRYLLVNEYKEDHVKAFAVAQ
jgi:hypothetical protein